jgi:hypothetical protein
MRVTVEDWLKHVTSAPGSFPFLSPTRASALEQPPDRDREIGVFGGAQRCGGEGSYGVSADPEGSRHPARSSFEPRATTDPSRRWAQTIRAGGTPRSMTLYDSIALAEPPADRALGSDLAAGSLSPSPRRVAFTPSIPRSSAAVDSCLVVREARRG